MSSRSAGSTTSWPAEVAGGETVVVPSPLDAVRSELADLELLLSDSQGIDIDAVGELLQSIFASGGKRIRPALVFLAAGLGKSDPGGMRLLAAAIETLHTATLIHDDLVDGSLVRRGAPTLNVRWSAGATVLAGDWLFARSARFATETGSMKVMEVFARTLGALTEGELRQLAGRKGIPTREEYDFRIYSKTASLFEAATECAGILLGFPAEGVSALATYGREVGNAFQVVDDLLDFTGDAERLGKSVGSDLRSGQVTLPVMLYLAHHPAAAPWATGLGRKRKRERGRLQCGRGRCQRRGRRRSGQLRADSGDHRLDRGRPHRRASHERDAGRRARSCDARPLGARSAPGR